jgi:hypothetical protein
MISLEFDCNETFNQFDVHKLDEKSIVLVSHNGFSYTRTLINKELAEKIITKLTKALENETESTELDSTN